MSRVPTKLAGESRLRLIATLSLAAVTTGLFTGATELLKERHDTYIQSCSTAAQVITDDALDADLDADARKAIVATADRELRRCWEK